MKVLAPILGAFFLNDDVGWFFVGVPGVLGFSEILTAIGEGEQDSPVIVSCRTQPLLNVATSANPGRRLNCIGQCDPGARVIRMFPKCHCRAILPSPAFGSLGDGVQF